jgi:hypothetical protein
MAVNQLQALLNRQMGLRTRQALMADDSRIDLIWRERAGSSPRAALADVTHA